MAKYHISIRHPHDAFFDRQTRLHLSYFQQSAHVNVLGEDTLTSLKLGKLADLKGNIQFDEDGNLVELEVQSEDTGKKKDKPKDEGVDKKPDVPENKGEENTETSTSESKDDEDKEETEEDDAKDEKQTKKKATGKRNTRKSSSTKKSTK